MNQTYSTLIRLSVYQVDDLLVEADFVNSTWVLALLDEESANYIPEAQGRLMGFSLRLDGSNLWDELCYVLVPQYWPRWQTVIVDCRQIDPSRLELLATSRAELQMLYEIERQKFRTIMADLAIGWQERE